MSTGVGVADDCINAFNEFKMGRNTYRWLFFKVSDDRKSIILDTQACGAFNKGYGDFLRALPAEDCRYAVYMFEYDTPSDGKRSKIVFFNWAPETAPTRSKMLYAGTKGELKKALVGISIEIQGTDMSEVDESEVLNKCKTVSK